MQSKIAVIHSVEELSRHISARLNGTDAVVVGVCGMAGSGKTTLCNKMIDTLPLNAVRLDCDQFSSRSYAQRQTLIEDATKSGIPQQIEFAENPKHWYCFKDIIAALHDLKTNRIHIHDRAWNRQTGELTGRYRIALAGDGPSVILCDCIYLLHPPIRAELDIAIMVETPEELVTERGLQRSKGDVSRAAYMERLRQRYTVPYFQALRDQVDIAYQTHV
ncbi:MAG: AAA family ATPase [Shinella sp.]|nr:AAA family ATPase [Shinella sp.]